MLNIHNKKEQLSQKNKVSLCNQGCITLTISRYSLSTALWSNHFLCFVCICHLILSKWVNFLSEIIIQKLDCFKCLLVLCVNNYSIVQMKRYLNSLIAQVKVGQGLNTRGKLTLTSNNIDQYTNKILVDAN